MEKLTCKQFRQLIAGMLSVVIDEIRAANENQFYYEFDMPPTDEEIDAFIISSECFDDEMKRFLLEEVGSMMIEE